MAPQPTVTGIGEILWDILPGGKALGGAPANAVYHCNALGLAARLVSRVGTDALGTEASGLLTGCGIDTQYVQIDAERATGTVDVTLSDGDASYRFATDCAWDYLAWTADLAQLARQSDAVIYGTLGQRSTDSRQTIRQFLQAAEQACLVCDVNIRSPHSDPDILAWSARTADILKLNDAELPTMLQALALPTEGTVAVQARTILHHCNLQLVCVTRGPHGSLLINADTSDDHPGISTTVADTVGAGDAFTAALVRGYLRGDSLAQINESANQLGSWVASCTGAMPSYDNCPVSH